MSAFFDLHRPGDPLLIPNPWDIGSARLLESLGFRALATTSSGLAATLGRLDGQVSREETMAHARTIVEATSLPVSADLEDCYAADEAGVADTVREAIAVGLAGCSIEDWDGTAIYPLEVATARVRAAVEGAGNQIVVTGRAENHIRGIDDLADTVARLQAYDEAGAHVLYAPGLERIEDIRAVVESVSRPVNVLVRFNAPTVAELAEAGVARISVGGSFAFAALGALVEAACELRDQGTTSYAARTATGLDAVRSAFAPPA